MLNEKNISNLRKNYESDNFNKIRRRMLNKVQIADLICDVDTNLDQDFSIEIKTHGITDQGQSGRCWFFAGLNILREKVIEKCNLDNFELSGSYIAFYDKLERFNQLLEKLISYKHENKDVYDRYVSHILKNGITDSGYFTQFANLIDKYGVVPKKIFPENFQSSNTYEINQILSRLLRKFYLDIEKDNDEETIKDKYLQDAYNILTNIYGMIPERFNFEYKDKNGVYHIDKNTSPKEFYSKYIGINLKEDYIEVASYQDELIKYNNIYEEEITSIISETKNNIVLNIPKDDFNKLMQKQISSYEPVYFYCSTTYRRIDGIWIDLFERYGDIFDIDLTIDKQELMRTNGITNCHCMIITGVNIIDKKIDKWKIENSWGNRLGKNGYYIASNDWVEKYVHRAVINKKYLDDEQLKITKQEPIKLTRWDIKF